MTPDDDEPSGSGWKLLCHFLDELSWPSLIAFGLVAFFFFYGCANGAIKLTGREVASFEFPIGPVFGAISALTLLIAGAFIKLRPRS